MNTQKLILEAFRKLSRDKQEDVIQFLDLIQQDLLEKPTDIEMEQAREILNRAKKRAMSSSPKSATQLWAEFNQVKNTIAEEYENQTN